MQIIFLLSLIFLTYLFFRKSNFSKLETIKLISVVVSILSLIFLIYVFVDKSEMLQRIGFFSFIAYSIGAIIGSLILPLIFWIIYLIFYLSENKKNEKKYQGDLSKIISSKEFGEEFKIKVNALENLLAVDAISKNDFTLKKQQLILRMGHLVYLCEELKLNQDQKEQVIYAFEKNVISADEYKIKIDQLSITEIELKKQISHTSE